MNNSISKTLLYSILGAMMADRRSSSDAKLPKNEVFKIGLMQALSAMSTSPMMPLIAAHMAAQDKIKSLSGKEEAESKLTVFMSQKAQAKQPGAALSATVPAATAKKPAPQAKKPANANKNPNP